MKIFPEQVSVVFALSKPNELSHFVKLGELNKPALVRIMRQSCPILLSLFCFLFFVCFFLCVLLSCVSVSFSLSLFLSFSLSTVGHTSLQSRSSSDLASNCIAPFLRVTNHMTRHSYLKSLTQSLPLFTRVYWISVVTFRIVFFFHSFKVCVFSQTGRNDSNCSNSGFKCCRLRAWWALTKIQNVLEFLANQISWLQWTQRSTREALITLMFVGFSSGHFSFGTQHTLPNSHASWNQAEEQRETSGCFVASSAHLV